MASLSEVQKGCQTIFPQGRSRVLILYIPPLCLLPMAQTQAPPPAPILPSFPFLLLLARLARPASMHTGTFPNTIQLLICYRLQWLPREPLSFLFIWSGSDVIKVTVNGECLVNWKPHRRECRPGWQQALLKAGRVAFLGGGGAGGGGDFLEMVQDPHSEVGRE
jgi:hypothetical protein